MEKLLEKIAMNEVEESVIKNFKKFSSTSNRENINEFNQIIQHKNNSIMPTVKKAASKITAKTNTEKQL